MNSTPNPEINTPSRYRGVASVLILCSLLLGTMLTAPAATLTVTTVDDSGPGSLRQAIADAAPADTIDFAVTGTITLTSGQLTIDKDLTINGPGATNLTVSGNNASRVFFSAGSVTISGITIAHGRVDSGGGGGILNSSGLALLECALVSNWGYPGGGAVRNSGLLLIVDSSISNNAAEFGGGIINDNGIVLLRYSTVCSNSATAGGGIWQGPGIADLVNSTISGNHVSGNGGGIQVTGGGTVTCTNCTVSVNNGWFQGGGLFVSSGSVSLRNTILAQNAAVNGADCSGPITSHDHNFIQNTNGVIISGVTTHNIYGQNPLLGPLADNGGPTWTHALLPGSPAIEHGSSGGLATDQRGLPRSSAFATYLDADDGSDIGAYELQGRSVTTLADGGPGSLRQAIADAAPGDTIDFAVTGTITLTSGELVIDKDLAISGPGATNLIVSGNNESRVFTVDNITALISGLTIANGYLPSYPGGEVGAGVRNRGALTITKCLITSNTNSSTGGIGGLGGGIENYHTGTLTIFNSTISVNHAKSGGGIENQGTLNLIGSTFSDNYATDGGAVSTGGSGGPLTATNVTISGNSSFWSGGGIWLSSSAVVCLVNSTVCSNSARFGGGVMLRAGTMYIHSTVVAGNRADHGSDCFVEVVSAADLISRDFNLFQDTNGAAITGVTAHNIYGQDPLLGPLADNGGPTWTHALLPGSPAIDHGSSGGLTTDQRGLPRVFNFPAYYDADDASDIGAVEMQEAPQTGPVFTVNATDDAEDGVPGIAHCSLREAIAAANANADTNTIDFAAEVPGLHTGVTGTITLTNGQLEIDNSATVRGPGAANLTVSGNHSNRVFQVGRWIDVTLSDLGIADGWADLGAGVYNRGWLTLANCALSGNVAEQVGGAVYSTASNGGTLTIMDGALYGNAAPLGGAICNAGAAAVVGCCILSNTASNGGGIWGVFAGSETRLTNSTITGNLASDSAGGIGNAIDSTVFIESCTICSNSAVVRGGGISFGGDYDDTFFIRNSIVAGNDAPAGPDMSTANTLISGDFNFIQDTNGCAITGDTTHNIYNQDPKLGPLADLGGPTPTHALRFDSPALDAGHSGGLITDQRGLPRPIDDPNTPNAEGGDGSDIGAYEADPNLRITAVEKAGENIRLRFNTVLGLTYDLEAEDALSGPWFPLSTNIPGTGSSIQVLDADQATLPQRFYRVGRNANP